MARHANALPSLRRRIDAIDRALLRLLHRRAALALRVGRIKRRLGQPVFDARREQAILRRVSRQAARPLSAAALRRIFREILQQCRALERSHGK